MSWYAKPIAVVEVMGQINHRTNYPTEEVAEDGNAGAW